MAIGKVLMRGSYYPRRREEAIEVTRAFQPVLATKEYQNHGPPTPAHPARAGKPVSQVTHLLQRSPPMPGSSRGGPRRTVPSTERILFRRGHLRLLRRGRRAIDYEASWCVDRAGRFCGWAVRDRGRGGPVCAAISPGGGWGSHERDRRATRPRP